MAEVSFPFEAGSGSFVTEGDWSSMAGVWQENGVNGFPSDTELLLSPGAARDTVKVSAGTAQIKGFHYRNTSDLVLATTKNLDPSVTRKDLVVATLDTGANTITAQWIAGTTSAYPTPDPATQIVLGKWQQLPESSASGSNWGSATDARWFAGRRVRPLINGQFPPVNFGDLGYVVATNELYIGKDVSGTATWQAWTPDDAHLNTLIGNRISKTLVTPSAPLSNTTTETVIGTFTSAVAANPTVGTVYRITINGTTDWNTGTLTFRLRFVNAAGTTIGSTVAITPTQTTGRRWHISADVTIHATGASGSGATGGNMRELMTATGAGNIQGVVPTGWSQDLASTRSVVLTGQWSAANAGNSVTVLSGSMVKID